MRWRQPSGQVWSFDSPTRGRYSIGSSPTRSLARAAWTIISEAYSIPGVRSPSVAYACASMARMPLWASDTVMWKKRLRMRVRIGLPM